ncbi:MAG: hypothetical protein ACOC2W_04615 [bacterium]
MIKLLKKIKYSFKNVDYGHYIYHGTNIDAAISIQNDKYIKPFTNDDNDKPVVSFTNDFDNAIHYANLKGKKMVILRTSINDKNFYLSPSNKYDHGNEFISYNKIPIDNVEVLINSERWIPLKEWKLNEH